MLRLRTALLVMPFIAANAISAHALSLKDALAATYMNNPQLEAARANLKATDEEAAKAQSGWRPNLTVTGADGIQRLVTDEPTHSESDRNQLTAAFTLAQPIYRGGRT